MKKYGIAHNDFVFCWTHIPDGSIYGIITTYSGTTWAFDKKGNRIITKKKAFANEVMFYCDDFKPVYVNGYEHYYIHVFNQTTLRWNPYVCTAQSPMYYDVAEYIRHIKESENISDNAKVKIYAGLPSKPITKHKSGGYGREMGSKQITDYTCGKIPRDWVSWR